MSKITLRDHVEMMRADDSISTRRILRIYEKLSDTITCAVFNPMMTDKIRRIYLDATPRSTSDIFSAPTTKTKSAMEDAISE